MISRPRPLFPWILVALLGAAPSQGADFAACADASAAGQALRLRGKFSAARAQLVHCVDASCPAVIRNDCAQRQDELDRLQPSIVFDVKDEAHHDVVQLDVAVDGQALGGKLAGLAIRVDPGPHTFTFTAPGHQATSVALVAHEGEKLRTERVVLVEPAGPGAPSPTGSEGTGGTQKTVGVVAGGAGVAGVALGAVFGLLASSALSKSRTACASAASCQDHPAAVTDYQNASAYGAASTAGFIAGGVLLAAGLTLFFTAPSGGRRGAAIRPLLVPSADAPGGAALLSGSF